jgi:hypothetical protein
MLSTNSKNFSSTGIYLDDILNFLLRRRFRVEQRPRSAYAASAGASYYVLVGFFFFESDHSAKRGAVTSPLAACRN